MEDQKKSCFVEFAPTGGCQFFRKDRKECQTCADHHESAIPGKASVAPEYQQKKEAATSAP